MGKGKQKTIKETHKWHKWTSRGRVKLNQTDEKREREPARNIMRSGCDCVERERGDDRGYRYNLKKRLIERQSEREGKSKGDRERER